MKTALMIIAPKDFRDEELFETKDVLEAAGITVVVASKSTDVARGMLGRKCTPDIPIHNAHAAKYDAVIFIGGPGAEDYFEDQEVINLARDAFKAKKLIGAICIAPCILANAGILQGCQITCFTGQEKYRESINRGGAVLLGAPVVIEKYGGDGVLITADGPQSARMFGEEIAGELGAYN